VLEIYEVLEAKYEPPALSSVPVLLVRASAGEGDDTPYRERYSSDDFGWRRVASRLELVDVQGGHSSMLQEDAIESLAAALSKHMGFLNLPTNAEASLVE
jgi:thioesterase domain-containing protein